MYTSSAVALVGILLLLVLPVSAELHPDWSGERNLGDEYRVTVHNTSGLKDITYHITVYDYKVIGTHYDYHSTSWGQDFEMPALPGRKYVAIWARIESDGDTWYGWGSDRFRVSAWGNTTLQPDSVPMQDLAVEYGSNRYLPLVIRDLQNCTGTRGELLTREWFGWKDENQLIRMEPGPSNAWDGLMLVQVPEDADPSELRVFMWTWYGWSVWWLTPHEELNQINPVPTTPRPVPVQTNAVRGAKLRVISDEENPRTRIRGQV
jgi:hypothetical protein